MRRSRSNSLFAITTPSGDLGLRPAASFSSPIRDTPPFPFRSPVNSVCPRPANSNSSVSSAKKRADAGLLRQPFLSRVKGPSRSGDVEVFLDGGADHFLEAVPVRLDRSRRLIEKNGLDAKERSEQGNPSEIGAVMPGD